MADSKDHSNSSVCSPQALILAKIHLGAGRKKRGTRHRSQGSLTFTLTSFDPSFTARCSQIEKRKHQEFPDRLQGCSWTVYSCFNMLLVVLQHYTKVLCIFNFKRMSRLSRCGRANICKKKPGERKGGRKRVKAHFLSSKRLRYSRGGSTTMKGGL